MTEQPPAIGLQQLLHDLHARVEERTRSEEQLGLHCETLERENVELRRQLDAANAERQRIFEELTRAQQIVAVQRKHRARVKAAALALLAALDDDDETSLDPDQLRLDLDK